MRYLLDTNILLTYIREKTTSHWIDENYDPLGVDNIPIISVVSVGEIRSLALRNGWGKKKYKLLENLMDQLVIADINAEDVLERYAEIDTFSQGKLDDIPLGTTSRNMGKNDLWIAATASVTNTTLLTTDADFNHLHQIFVDVIKIEIKK